MKNLKFYKGQTEEKVFESFLKSLQQSITMWDYFVNWEKVKDNVKIFNTELNILNSLIGSKNIDNDFVELCKKYPEIKIVLPLLIAVRKKKLKDMCILQNTKTLEIAEVENLFNKDNDDFKNLSKFFKESGLRDIFTDKSIKNLVDYVTGIEVGMDTNGRKNRIGTLMEDIVEEEIKEITKKRGYEYGKEMTAKKISEQWGVDVPTDKSKRRFDFVIHNKKEIILIEVNFYSGGGTKLKATAGEYAGLGKIMKDSGFKFIWITDGLGWHKAHLPLQETFVKNDYVFNLDMIKSGILEEIL